MPDIVPTPSEILNSNDRGSDVARRYRYQASYAATVSLELVKKNSKYVKDLEWLEKQIDEENFISIHDYRKRVLDDKIDKITFKEDFPVTLEISACQYFPFFVKEAQQSVENHELMPGRFIRVRAMKEQENDNDLLAMSIAMQMIGVSWCETLDTRGTDGSNVHLGGPETITGYFGGVGEPNDYPIKWLDEFLYYHTNYGIKQVLNDN